MSLQPAFHESLPYIDTPPSPGALASAHALIAAEATKTSPPSSQPPPSPRTTIPPLDLTPYASPTTLAPTATAHTHLTTRLANLALLDAHGKHAWLLHNHALEAELAALERELAATKRDVDVLNIERRSRQEAVRAEMEGLEKAWREGVGRVLETEVAVQEVREQIRAELRRRAAAEGGGAAKEDA